MIYRCVDCSSLFSLTQFNSQTGAVLITENLNDPALGLCPLCTLKAVYPPNPLTDQEEEDIASGHR